MENSIKEVISNALVVNKKDLSNNIKTIFYKLKDVLDNSKDLIKQANDVDEENNNGFTIDFDVIDSIFNNIKEEDTFYGDVNLSHRDEKNKILYGNQVMDFGNVVVVSDGNPYITIEMIVRNLIAGNTTILTNNGYMYGTNQLIVNLVQSVLEQYNLSKNLIQLYVTDNYDEVLSNYANIDLVVCVGNHNLQSEILNKTRNRIIVSGYENFEMYIEDDKHKEFIDKIMNLGLNVTAYINSELDFEYANSIMVDDIDEAIGQINYGGSRYSSSIFTSSSENASKFIREVKSKIVSVNTSPTIERIIDIKQKDLINQKTIIYPFNFKFDGNSEYINLNQKEEE